MDDLERTARRILQEWAETTLQMFRERAEKELNGTALISMRTSTDGIAGRRTMLAICMTGAHQISLAERLFNFVDSGVAEDWDSYTLTRMLVDAEMTEGLGYQDLRDANKKRIAVALAATWPDKIELLSKIFSLPT